MYCRGPAFSWGWRRSRRGRGPRVSQGACCWGAGVSHEASCACFGNSPPLKPGRSGSLRHRALQGRRAPISSSSPFFSRSGGQMVQTEAAAGGWVCWQLPVEALVVGGRAGGVGVAFHPRPSPWFCFGHVGPSFPVGQRPDTAAAKPSPESRMGRQRTAGRTQEGGQWGSLLFFLPPCDLWGLEPGSGKQALSPGFQMSSKSPVALFLGCCLWRPLATLAQSVASSQNDLGLYQVGSPLQGHSVLKSLFLGLFNPPTALGSRPHAQNGL